MPTRWYELPVKVDKTENLLKPLLVLRQREVLNSLDLFIQWLYAMALDAMPQRLCLCHPEKMLALVDNPIAIQTRK